MTNKNKPSSTEKDRSDFKVLIVYPNLPLMLVPSIAIALFTRILKDQGYLVELFETTHYDTDEIVYSESQINYSENRVNLLNARSFDVKDDLGIDIKSNMLSDFTDKVSGFKPDLMVFSVVEDTFLQTLAMLSAVEDLNIPHVLGGVFPTMAPEPCMAPQIVKMIALGEGEKTITEVSERVRQGQKLNSIAGTWLKSNTNDIEKTPQPPLVDINKITSDFSLFDESRFMRPMGGRIFKMVPVESYRGCPYACTYCNSPSQRSFSKTNGLGNFMRRKSIENLRDNLRYYVDTCNPDFFFFVDDSFLARPREEIWDFCDMYQEFRLPFYFNTRSENCDEEILRRIKDVGCYRMAFGIESGNEQFRQKVLRRKISNAEITKRFKIIAESGIAFSINLIIGMPGETREHVMDTIKLARSISGYDSLTSFIFTPYHGTALRTMAIENGWLDPKSITRHNTSRSILNMPPPYLNADEIDGLVATLPLYCYFPESDWDDFRRAETPDEEGLAIRKHYSDIYKNNFLNDNQDEDKILIETRANGSAADGAFESKKHFSDQRLVGLTSPMIGL